MLNHLFSSLNLCFKEMTIYTYICVCVWCVYVCHSVPLEFREQLVRLDSHVGPCVKLRLSVLVASTFTCWTTSLPLTEAESEVKDLQGFVYFICDSFKPEIISKQFIHVRAPNYNLFAFFSLDYCCSKNHKKKKPCEITALVKAADINLGCLSFPRVYMPSFLVLMKLESYSKHNFVTCFLFD